ncbi:DUF1189 family protein [Legionella oakridgensis]|uniref:DUF1189 domain-containing protein n=2 Tax=Legionella oakridgensis TaxID=29423 RepID=W0BBR8_9GAMM|nr:DUF1189 family protein [Legionella oakridgensis]AHE67275.1 hypothetical protein Loa_01728 [Legionella oakridgensis ATCC 33761 = DSM 21215]ETO93105.1 hypothetical protein LOR_80c23200 [Legionella oakridgensis RV-2-2007]KTD37936.1 hypothetical protein Loak_1612 [Legionella oakridgensis]STY20343.1 Protein of uncharacterised function (DUF1189) [Legionella longbeachae]
MSKNSQKLRRVDAPIFRYWHAFYMSFYSRRLYVDVSKRWRGFGLIYLFLILLIASIPPSIRIIMDFNQFFNEQVLSPLGELPPLYIQNGKVLFDKPIPYLIKNKQGKVVLMVDTMSTKADLPKLTRTYPDLNVLITKDAMYYRPPTPRFFFSLNTPMPSSSFYEQSFPNYENEVFVGQEIIKSASITRIKYMAELLIYFFVFAFFYSIYLVLMITLAFLGQVFAQVLLNVKIKYKESCRLFAIAATPQIVLFISLFTANFIFPNIGFFFLGLLAIYYYYAVMAVKSERNKMVIS